MSSASNSAFQGYGYTLTFYNTEHLDRYRPGGLHPIIIGDTLGPDNEYKVVHKLGHGGYGTVWLCRDTVREKWKAVKVLAASETEDNNSDLRVMRLLGDVPRDELNKHHIGLPESHFYQTGPNGTHLCLVLPVLGDTIVGAWEDFGGDRPDILKYICAAMCEAMKFLHDHNICHGDFRPHNMCYQIPGIEDMNEEEVMAMVPEHIPIEVGPIPGTDEGPGPHIPEFVYEAQPLLLPDELMANEFMVVDFGEAYEANVPPARNGIPKIYAAPEIVLGPQPAGFGADVWALAACFCHIRQGSLPFNGDDIFPYVQRLEYILGPLPQPYRSAWFEKGFEMPDRLVWVDEPVSMTVEQLDDARMERLEFFGYEDILERLVYDKARFTQMGDDGDLMDDPEVMEYQTPADEAAQLLDLIREVFKYDPAERPSVEQIMCHEWFEGMFAPVETQAEEDDEGLEREGSDGEMDIFYDAEEYLFHDAVEFQEPDSPLPEYRRIRWSDYWYVTLI